ncbi:MerR family transcriptional regulator [Kribbella sp. NBC_01245]|uniref:MerR family transcriptional regulator n=1 Tax=Kribbella sp. NBC_01245 TaxID=2903578 RepID=UPI002E290D9F|nr:MerR family transcriptional regulator [Kribbella sp. NBC_01245]
MDGSTLYSIGELARRTGLSVKTVRFYSDRGIVLPVDRSPAGYRRYDLNAVARLDLVRTLRDLGLDLATIQQVLDHEVSLTDVATAHAEALAVQIRTLRLRRAVLTAVAKRGSTPEELDLMHKLANLSEAERHHLINDFLNDVFSAAPATTPTAGGGVASTGVPGVAPAAGRGVASAAGLGSASSDASRVVVRRGGVVVGGVDGGFAAARRSMTPELPENPEPEQVEAWVELAELMSEADFRAGIRQLVQDHAADLDRAVAIASTSEGTDGRGGAGVRRGFIATVREVVRPALQGGVEPSSAAAKVVVSKLVAEFVGFAGCPGSAGCRESDEELRAMLLRRLESAAEPGRQRYLELLAVINGWPKPEALTPTLAWSIEAVRARRRLV